MRKEKVLQFKKRENTTPSISKAYAIFNEGKFLYNKDKDDLALEKFIAAEKAGYESSEMFTFMAWLYGRGNEHPDLVIKYADKAIELDDQNGYIYYLKAYTYADNDKVDEAIKNFLQAEDLGYEICALYTRLSYLYQLKNDFLKALAYASKAIKKFPDDEYTYFRKGGTYYCCEQYPQALKYFLRAEKTGKKDAEIYFKISYCYSMISDTQKALVYANKAIAVEPNSPYGYYRKGFIYYQNDNYEKALKAYLSAEKRCTDAENFYDMFSRISWIYQNKNNVDTAMLYADKALELNPKDAFSQYRKGCVLAYGLKKYTEALKYYKKSYKLDKNFVELYFDIANSYMNIKRYKLGLKYLEEGLELFPNNLDLLSIKASLLYLAGKTKDSKAILDNLIKEKPEDLWVRQAYAMATGEMKNYDEAISYLEPIVKELKDINPMALCALGYAYLKVKKFEKSLDAMLLYAQNEDQSCLEAKDKKVIRRIIEKLDKKFPQNSKLQEIKRLFKNVIKL